MKKATIVSLVSAASLLAACSAPAEDAAQPDGSDTIAKAEAEVAPTGTDTPPAQAAIPDVGDGDPDLMPAPLAGDAERGEEGARNVLLAFIRAIELKEFGQAHEMMRGQARDSGTAVDFASQFTDFGKITVSAPGGRLEGAAGTTYYTAPATITGGNGQTLSGDIVLSRVNDVPGASEDQLRWRVARFDMDGTD
ncbi:hypothetical protein [Alteriqipengyuania lutimaris]|uniref:hypothetical protein n=1 Tax=Alteriqipengyuania lutimaris TaxID=1538146 RepID=UPI00180C6DC5|nr:hypothetical protein [Alteriqipengyuania lutimaris]MBB3035009.1 hypothetical protein [Alteriqipengyuania lutimaris]